MILRITPQPTPNFWVHLLSQETWGLNFVCHGITYKVNSPTVYTQRHAIAPLYHPSPGLCTLDEFTKVTVLISRWSLVVLLSSLLK